MTKQWFAGVDGCRGGWLVVLWDGKEKFRHKVCSEFENVIEIAPEPSIIAVDMPIGLIEKNPPNGGRKCDKEARQLLGPLMSSVFSPPARKTLWEATDFRSAQQLNQPAGLTIQAFGLFKKLRQVDKVMSEKPELQERIKEVHPELCFYGAAGGRPMEYSAHTPEGKEERKNILTKLFGSGWQEWYQEVSQRYPSNIVAIKDILDASVAVWTAERIKNGVDGQRKVIPANPPKDNKGLRMEMWFYENKELA